ncbi:hypothetical protein B0O80DRAFT_268323 [Mortierella sp. GBAus27b]|nr:hypothetical protein B0O80DRAFT_268323 [Mortierella sp. GBAus27b]
MKEVRGSYKAHVHFCRFDQDLFHIRPSIHFSNTRSTPPRWNHEQQDVFAWPIRYNHVHGAVLDILLLYSYRLGSICWRTYSCREKKELCTISLDGSLAPSSNRAHSLCAGGNTMMIVLFAKKLESGNMNTEGQIESIVLETNSTEYIQYTLLPSGRFYRDLIRARVVEMEASWH